MYGFPAWPLRREGALNGKKSVLQGTWALRRSLVTRRALCFLMDFYAYFPLISAATAFCLQSHVSFILQVS